MDKDKKEVSVHIDKKDYKSPTPTTGAALYVLGNIDPNNYDLYEEVHGHGDDIHIDNDNKKVELKNGAHFYSVQKHINPGNKYE